VRWPWLLLVALVLGLSGCGYHLVGSTSFLPDELTDLHLTTFENRTRWADVDQRLTESLAREIVRRRRFEIVDRPADAQIRLEGEIVTVGISPVRLDEQGRATEYQMTLTVSTRLVDIRGEKPEVLWQDPSFSRRTSYDVDVSAVDYFDRQVEALDELTRDLAQALVTAMLEGF
jgi:outer membrane lipopolysaccharide assembly protein LptE/RlpB